MRPAIPWERGGFTVGTPVFLGAAHFADERRCGTLWVWQVGSRPRSRGHYVDEVRWTTRRKERAVGSAGTLPAGCENASVSEVVIREGESFEAALKKFTRRVQQDGLLSEAKRRQHYESPSIKRKRKADARERKQRKIRAKLAAQGL